MYPVSRELLHPWGCDKTFKGVGLNGAATVSSFAAAYVVSGMAAVGGWVWIDGTGGTHR